MDNVCSKGSSLPRILRQEGPSHSQHYRGDCFCVYLTLTLNFAVNSDILTSPDHVFFMLPRTSL